MPTGYPKDPAAHAAILAAALKRRVELKTEESGQPVKRSHTKRVVAASVAPVTTNTVVEDKGSFYINKNGDTVKRVQKKRIYKPRGTGTAQKITELNQEVTQQQSTIASLEDKLESRELRIEELEGLLILAKGRRNSDLEAVIALQKRAADSERRLVTVIDLVSKVYS